MNSEFDRFAGEYEELLKDPVRDYFAPGSGFFVTRKLDMLLAFAAETGMDTKRATWVDVGCGKGDLLRAGRAAFARVIGCDVSEGMVTEAGDPKAGDLDLLLQPDATTLPFEDQSADLLTAVCVYHHIEPRWRAALTAEIRRVLRPGGVFAMIEHNPVNPAVQLIVRRTPVDEHAILLMAGTTRRLMREAGLRVVGTRYFLYVPERMYALGAPIEKALQRVPFGGQYVVFGTRD